MEIRTFQSSNKVAKEAAIYIADRIRKQLAVKDFFTMAISGGRTPWEMIKKLATEDLPWDRINLFQVDERVAPDGHPDRNLTQLFNSIQDTKLMTQINIFPMHVVAEDIQQACEEYSETIQRVTKNGKFDLVHLGIGTDGHTASLIPGDGVLNVQDKDVAMTDHPYQGRQRMTLTYPIINRSEKILWVVTGEEKAEMLNKLLQQDPNIPAGKISQHRAILLTEECAAIALK